MNQKPTSNRQATSQQNWLLVIGVVALTVIPLAQKAITEIQPGYKPWFNHLFEPASGEVASLLFATQAALGAGAIGYAIGLYKGRSQSQQSDDKSPLE
jgi:cobalt/nickel transport protein